MSALPRLTRRGLLLAGAGVSLVLIGAFSGFTDLVRAGIFALLLLVLSVLTLLVATRASAQVRHVGPRLPLEPGDRERVAVHAELVNDHVFHIIKSCHEFVPPDTEVCASLHAAPMRVG